MALLCQPEDGSTHSQERMEKELSGSPALPCELFPMGRLGSHCFPFVRWQSQQAPMDSPNGIVTWLNGPG